MIRLMQRRCNINWGDRASWPDRDTADQLDLGFARRVRWASW